jgi:sensor domain CHASE-containing protein
MNVESIFSPEVLPALAGLGVVVVAGLVVFFKTTATHRRDRRGRRNRPGRHHTP